MRSVNIAVLEDDADQAEVLSLWLEHEGWAVSVFETGKALRDALRKKAFDLFVLDWHLPDTTGIETLDWLKSHYAETIPVIFLTVRDAEPDIVAALTKGADDYIVKPPSQAVTIARIATVLRRYGVDSEETTLDRPPFKVDLKTRKVFRDDEEIALTRREYELTAYLFSHVGQLLPRDALLEQIWGITASINTRTIDTHVSRLRSKLGLGDECGWRLSSVYQYGYRLEHIGP
ncbi:MAG: response regulator transcription factor [Pseudomonadota bacterium]